MTIFIVLRQDQNDHGYVDTSIAGVFREEHAALEFERLEAAHAKEESLIVEADDSPAGEWQVCWTVEEHVVS